MFSPNFVIGKRILLFLLVFNFTSSAFSQEKGDVHTIKIEKETKYAKAAFNEADYKVIAFDRFGNPHEKAIKSFSIVYHDGKTNYEAPVMGNTFPSKTIDFLTKKRATATKVCLTKIMAGEDEAHLEKLPDLCDIVIFPDCKKVNKNHK